MLNEYMYNYQTIISSFLFIAFKIILIAMIVLLILSLILLAIGCLIKSQKLRSKFLIIVPNLLVGIVIFLSIPIIFVRIKNMM